MNTTMGQVMVNAARQFGHKAAIVVGESEISFVDLDLWSSRIAYALQALGIGKGDRISLYAPSGLYWVAAYYGIFKAGAVVNPINMGFSTDEVAVAIKNSEAVAVIGTRDLLENLLPYSSKLDLQHWVAMDGPGSTPLRDFERLKFAGSVDYEVIDVQDSEIAVIAYTSGTTGFSKAAMLTHRGLLMVASNCVASQERTQLDTVVTAIPSFHMHGAMMLNSAMMAGMTLVLHPDFAPERMLSSIERHRATLFEGMPVMFLSMLDCLNQARYDLSSLTRCTIAGQSISVAKIQHIEEIFGAPIIELWGQTETCGACTANPLTGKKIGSIGLPLPGIMMRIADPKDYRQELNNHEVGELLIKSPTLMQGYLNNAQLNAQVIEADGWFHTGDLCYRDDDGFFYLIDRLVDMITVSGRAVYPADVEHVIAEHGQVGLVGVIGVSNPEGNAQLVKAYVVAAPLAQIDVEDLLRFCREHLEDYQIPTIIQIVDALPKTATGKVSRHALRQL